MRKYIKDFFNDESGMETLEWLCILAVVAVLIGICIAVGKTIKSKTAKIAGSL